MAVWIDKRTGMGRIFPVLLVGGSRMGAMTVRACQTKQVQVHCGPHFSRLYRRREASE